MNVRGDAPAVIAATQAIHTGDVEFLKGLLAENTHLAKARINGKRTLLHVATDWPGHFPNSAATINALVKHGAQVNAAYVGRHRETALHWAASSDDIAALDVLLDSGADLEAMGGVKGGGTPLADAVAFGQWRAARRLVERGAKATLWEASALGMMDRVKDCFAIAPVPADEVTNAFWFACHGGQQPVAEYLLARGADLNWVGYDGRSPLDAASRDGFEELVK
jgi:uncharacterized protein